MGSWRAFLLLPAILWRSRESTDTSVVALSTVCSFIRKYMAKVRFPAGAGNRPLHHRVHNGSEAHPASYPMDTGALSLGVKRPGRETDHSSPSSAEVKNAWSYTSTPPIRLHGVVISYRKAEGKLYIYLYLLRPVNM
jgi:hypothetical protein